MKPYDIIIAGGGASGLSLAYHLVHSPLRDCRVLIVEKEAKDQNDRTWCFWTDRPTLFDDIVYRSWSPLQVLGEHETLTLDLHGYRYKMIRGIDFYRFARQTLSVYPHVDFLQGKVERLKYTCSAIMFYWGVDRVYPQLGTHNVFLAGDYHASFDRIFNDHLLPDEPSFYVHAPAPTRAQGCQWCCCQLA